MNDYKVSNNKRYRYNFNINDNYGKYTWCVPLKTKNAQTKMQEFANIFSTLKRSSVTFENIEVRNGRKLLFKTS